MTRKRRTGRTPVTMFIALTRSWPGGWAKAKTAEKAIAAVKAEWGIAHIKAYGYVLYAVDPKTMVDEMASFIYPKGSPPTLIKTVEGEKRPGIFKQAPKPPKPVDVAV
jgi:hypothetical protein